MVDILKGLYPKVKASELQGRHITIHHLKDTCFYHQYKTAKRTLGASVQQIPIDLFTVGSGTTKVLMWSQMHGNESTTTKALADLFYFLKQGHHIAKSILDCCTLYVIPMLNPDGALMYTRANANAIDLNRDAQDCSQPESKILRALFEEIQPHFCFNLHDQRSIYGVGNTAKSAVVSFLSPSQDKEATISPHRRKSMQLIAAMNHLLQKAIPGHIGRYDDTFNIQCVGDTFQALGVPTVLFEAGHFEDYAREDTRQFIFYALVQGLYTISKDRVHKHAYESYFDIPENGSHFFDVLLTHVPFTDKNGLRSIGNVGIHYEEVLKNNSIDFLPIVKKIGNLTGYYGHQWLNYSTERNTKISLKDQNIQKIIDDLVNY